MVGLELQEVFVAGAWRIDVDRGWQKCNRSAQECNNRAQKCNWGHGSAMSGHRNVTRDDWRCDMGHSQK